MTSNAELDAAATTSGHDQVPVLLVEDDDGDALLVEELLLEVDAPVVVKRARSLGQATTLISDAACVLLDLGLPDSQGLQGLRHYLKASMVMHTGEKASSEQLDQSLVRFTTPDKNSGADAIATGVSDRYSMSHVFRRETDGAGEALRSQVFQSD